MVLVKANIFMPPDRYFLFNWSTLNLPRDESVLTNDDDTFPYWNKKHVAWCSYLRWLNHLSKLKWYWFAYNTKIVMTVFSKQSCATLFCCFVSYLDLK